MHRISHMTNQVLNAFSRRPPAAAAAAAVRINSETAAVPSSAAGTPRTPCNDRLRGLRNQLDAEREAHDLAAGTDDVQMSTDDAATSQSGDVTGAAIDGEDDDDDDAMDWEECMQEMQAAAAKATAATPAGPQADCLVVLDTNVLIGELALVRQIMQEQRRASEAVVQRQRIQLLVPYVVLKELDGLKAQRNTATGRQAQSAIRLVHDALKSADWRLQAERPRDERDDDDDNSRSPAAADETNDDRILQCAVRAQRQRVARKENVCLLSDDVNFRNFAMLHDVQTMSTAEWRRSEAGNRGAVAE